MNFNRIRTLLVVLAVGQMASLTVSCTAPVQAGGNDAETMSKTTATAAMPAEVTVTGVRQGIFDMELVSNGRLQAVERALVPFAVNEMITEVSVKEGDAVVQGQKMAQLEPFAYARRLENSQTAYDKAEMDLEDQLIGMGYAMADTAKVPANVLKMARIRSGYNSAVTGLAEARRNLSLTTIKAPVSGRVANMEAKANHPSAAYKSFCDIIDNRTMDVIFQLLETEMGQLTPGQVVEVIPYSLSGSHYQGTVTSINPTIDDKGMVRVTAMVLNSSGELMDGMNAKVLVKKGVPNCLIVPKSAVIYRQNRKVVFVHDKGKALWVYVETGFENSTEVTITSGLKTGQQVIVGNNTDLAHESPVTVIVQP